MVYQLCDHLNTSEAQKLKGRSGVVVAIKTGEVRQAKKGEWYIADAVFKAVGIDDTWNVRCSGAYRSPEDTVCVVEIAKLVRIDPYR